MRKESVLIVSSNAEVCMEMVGEVDDDDVRVIIMITCLIMTDILQNCVYAYVGHET